MKVSFIATVFNEEATVKQLLESLLFQSRPPDEIIIVDGGSTDATASVILGFKSQILNKQTRFKFIIKKGNRSIGRNEAIKNAGNEIIICSDAGCVLDKDWVRNILKPFENPKVDVVSGYYKGKARTVFEKCLIPYALVMPDRIDKNIFLPAGRSVAFKKSIWKKVGGYPEEFSNNEDYIFANKLKEFRANIVFEKKAIAYWFPRKNIKDAFVMFYRFALGDSECGIIRDKVMLIFARYFFGFYLLWLVFIEKSLFLLIGIILSVFFYIYWSIKKNYQYVNDKKAFIILPILQFTSDLAVLTGTVLGIIKRIAKINYRALIRSNLVLIGLIGIYILSLLFVISTGIPSQNHPFPYQMDEWHQLSAVKNVFKYGSPNLPGSANGTMFHFFYSGILLIPFVILKIVNPLSIKSAVDSINLQNTLFILLRLNTLFFGVLTLITVSKIAKLLKVNSNLAVLLFFVTPVWLSLSNFFKYDIALVFWITVSLYYLIKYCYLPSPKNFIIGSLFAGIAFSVKVTGLTMLPVIILAYLLFTPLVKNKYLYLLSGLFIYILTSVFLGLPDIIFGGKSMYSYLYDNIIGISEYAKNYKPGHSLFALNFLHKFPDIFGHALYLLTVITVIYLFISLVSNLIRKKYGPIKLRLFLLLSFFIFLITLFSLGIFIVANRAVVLLPFVIFLNLLAFKDLLPFFRNNIHIKRLTILIFAFLLLIQFFESYIWVAVKILPLPQQLSSSWVLKNIPAGSKIGLENIPIYQFEPDFITKEFYYNQYHPSYKIVFSYFVINSKSANLPKFIIISDVYHSGKYYKNSDKNDLVKRIRIEGYKEFAYFPLKIPFYSYFDSNFDYLSMGLTAYPQSISIFEKISDEN